MLTGAQIRAGRGLINLSVSELAERSGLAINTIRRAEATNSTPPITAANLTMIRAVLEGAGVTFIPADELGPGVRLTSLEPLPRSTRRRSI